MARRVGDVGLEAVQRFDAEDDAMVGGAPARHLQPGDDPIDAAPALVLIHRLRRPAGEHQRRAIERPADDGRAERHGACDGRAQYNRRPP